MFGKILVCLDGSAFAEEILPCASGKALMAQSEITLLSVATQDILHYPVPSGELTGFIPFQLFFAEAAEREIKMRAYLKKVAAGLTARGLRVASTVIPGLTVDISDIIVRYSVEHGHDLIAMATHGHRGLKRLFFGSITESVMRKSHVPVLAVRPNAPPSKRSESPQGAASLDFATG